MTKNYNLAHYDKNNFLHFLSYFTDPAWHLIIGGDGYAGHLNTVELFNWKTKEQCYLTNLTKPRCTHTGVIFEGVPVICGGFPPRSDCDKYNKNNGTWVEVRKLMLVKPSLKIN